MQLSKQGLKFLELPDCGACFLGFPTQWLDQVSKSLDPDPGPVNAFLVVRTGNRIEALPESIYARPQQFEKCIPE